MAGKNLLLCIRSGGHASKTIPKNAIHGSERIDNRFVIIVMGTFSASSLPRAAKLHKAQPSSKACS
eukprot:1138005-Pelagomonas_calceolata.AAC.2